MSTNATRSDLKAALRLLDNQQPKFDDEEDALEYQRLMELRRDIEVDDGDDAEDLSEFCEHRLNIRDITIVYNREETDHTSFGISLTCRHCQERAAVMLQHVDFGWQHLECSANKPPVKGGA
jgi:hypothetical protein